MQAVRLAILSFGASGLSSWAYAATPFAGAWVPNTTESVSSYGSPPMGIVTVIVDDGHRIGMVQTFLNQDGKRIRYIWSAVCDGKSVTVGGDGLKLGMQASCERVSERVMRYLVTTPTGPRHEELCTVSPDGRKSTYRGTDSFPDGTK